MGATATAWLLPFMGHVAVVADDRSRVAPNGQGPTGGHVVDYLSVV
jgi:hypothetical protein